MITRLLPGVLIRDLDFVPCKKAETINEKITTKIIISSNTFNNTDNNKAQ